MKRRSRKQWYHHHLFNAQEQARNLVTTEFEPEIENVRAAERDAYAALTAALKQESMPSRLFSLFGGKTDYRRTVLPPLESDLAVSRRALADALARRSAAWREAERDGEASYLQAREVRRKEAEARAERVAQRQYERRLRYLEESPALRSAARPLKEHLLREQSLDGLSINCFYCTIVIPVGESHLEHKRPLSRGGTNSRTNLVLSCAPCNLRKGRNTHEEFIRELGDGAP